MKLAQTNAAINSWTPRIARAGSRTREGKQGDLSRSGNNNSETTASASGETDSRSQNTVQTTREALGAL
ncbi:hypothetical protein EYF80_010130 [Liparis tanakae]|uniref:Uncharacterized protein n=1 Tax=Liparis tanakae TaxID=230148 RepID=A0A4Z2IPF6_9TELE|nr:hypothetical protein EYF80_010130 [Liparis tanakae]